MIRALLIAALLIAARVGVSHAQTPTFDAEFSNSSQYLPPTASGLGGGGGVKFKSVVGGTGQQVPAECSYSSYFGDLNSTPSTVPFSVAGGVMTITTQPGANPGVSYCGSQTLPYVSGMLNTLTLPGGAFTKGRIEVRAKLFSGGTGPLAGLWPAIWLLPTNTNAPPEIDIMETLSRFPATQVTFTTHYSPPGDYSLSEFHLVTLPNSGVTTGYHIYGLDFDSTKPGSAIKMYIDDVLIATATMQGSMVNGGPYYLMVNNAVGAPGSWPCQDDNGAPLAGCPSLTKAVPMLVDYIRVYPAGTVLP